MSLVANSIVPLFPLPAVVLLPRAVLPLHIFEERYRRMTTAALAGDKRIAMAQPKLRGAFADDGRSPLDAAVCVGTIVAQERLADGRYNFLLRGDGRARIVRELEEDLPYRLAEVETLVEPSVLEIDLERDRRRLRSLFAAGGRLAASPAAGKFHELLDSLVPTPAVADLLAFHLLDDVVAKQQLLAETDPLRRVKRVVTLLAAPSAPAGPMASDGRVDVNLN